MTEQTDSRAKQPSQMVCGQGKLPSRQTSGQRSHRKWLAPQKTSRVEELGTLPVGIRPWTSHHLSPGGERRRKTKHSAIFFKGREKCHCQTNAEAVSNAALR